MKKYKYNINNLDCAGCAKQVEIALNKNKDFKNVVVNDMVAAYSYYDYIFTDVSTCETELVCLPVINVGINNDLLSFFKNIVFSIQFDQTENCDHVAKIINFLSCPSKFFC